ncbi:SCO family protein [Comamonas flocculans]|uniref:SCO family protein n=1 Tax=Comamonas flocculans TaxID=2597701 RepID=UPI002103EA75|nr:SCO family protein [Comamonas flocculans]
MVLRTALISLLVAIGGYAAASWLTHDFRVWTEEGARRLEVALAPVPLPEVALQGTRLPAPTLAATARGSVTIADFFYTRCQTVCLSLGSTFQQLQARLQTEPQDEGAAPLRLLSLSFDGAHDSAAVLQAYAGKLGADPDLWRFASVPDAAQQRALLERLGVVVIPDELGEFEHNAALLVFDARGRMVRVFDLAEQELALNYARQLASKRS